MHVFANLNNGHIHVHGLRIDPNYIIIFLRGWYPHLTINPPPFGLQVIDIIINLSHVSIHVKYCIDDTIFSLIFICFNNFNNKKWLYDWFWFWIHFLSNHGIGNKAKKKKHCGVTLSDRPISKNKIKKIRSGMHPFLSDWVFFSPFMRKRWKMHPNFVPLGALKKK